MSRFGCRLGWLGVASLLVLAVATGAPAADVAGAAPRPNVVLILADDLGWADVGWHGDEIKTPNLDRLAAAGARLEQFYVQPVCSPTRAALMTGRYPMRHGLQVGVVRPWAQYGLPLEERTLAQALKEAGYETAICGKWHLGHFQPAYLPTRRGFDHQYGHYNGALDYFTHIRDGGFDWHRDDRASRDEGYSTHLIAREAARLVAEHDPARPLFLYVPFNAVHAPHQVPESYKAPYATLQEPRRTYAGMVAAMDEAVGQIVAAIDRKGMRPNTLFIFSSDNGGPAPGRVTSNGPLRAQKATLYEGGVRVPACADVGRAHQAGYRRECAAAHGRLVPDPAEPRRRIARADPPARRPRRLARDHAGRSLAARRDPAERRSQRRRDPRRRLEARPQRLCRSRRRRRGGREAATENPGQNTVELFNLAADPYEKNNLAAANPAKVKELRTRYDAFAREAVPPKVRPKPAGFQSPKVWGEVE